MNYNKEAINQSQAAASLVNTQMVGTWYLYVSLYLVLVLGTWPNKRRSIDHKQLHLWSTHKWLELTHLTSSEAIRS